jgi:hypothetical protein
MTEFAITHESQTYRAKIKPELHDQIIDKKHPFHKEAIEIAQKIVLIKNQINIKQ